MAAREVDRANGRLKIGRTHSRLPKCGPPMSQIGGPRQLGLALDASCPIRHRRRQRRAERQRLVPKA
jgi:hypothetical protein